MYKDIDVSTVLSVAKEFVEANDRSLYALFFKSAEKFISDNGILLGGKIACDLAAKTPINKDSYMWDLYTDDIFETAKQLADVLASTKSPHVPARTTELQTNIRHREFTIYVNARLLFKIYSLDKYRGVKLANVMPVHTCDGYFGNKVRCISNELLLVDIYRQLYSPSRLADWPAALDAENILFTSLPDSVKFGGNVQADAVKLRAEFSKKLPADAIVVGDYAFSELNIIQNANSKMQIISAAPLDELVSRMKTKGKVFYEEHKLNIPSDFQITKHTIYLSDGREQTPVLEVFNSSKFEMIPYKHTKRYKVGNLWVLLRFIFIDIWILRIIMKMKNSDLTNRINSLLNIAKTIRKMINPAEVFQLDNYEGVHINEGTAKKKLIKEMGDRFPPYYPARKMERDASNDLSAANTTEITVITKSDTTVITKNDTTDTTEAASAEITKSGGAEITKFATPIDTPVDLSGDFGSKYNILKKVTGSVKKIRSEKDIMHALAVYSRAGEQSKWGVGKSTSKFFVKNEFFIPFITHMPGPLVICDIGCGDGSDIESIETRFEVSRGICADIVDSREDTAKLMEFVTITPGQQLDIQNNTADLVLVFHCIHHMMDDVAMRVSDICRITRPGGLIFVKDHDVTSPVIASNVDLEHLAYYVAGKNIATAFKSFRAEEPMRYYTREYIHFLFAEAGCELVDTKITSKLTNVFSSVFKKK